MSEGRGIWILVAVSSVSLMGCPVSESSPAAGGGVDGGVGPIAGSGGSGRDGGAGAYGGAAGIAAVGGAGGVSGSGPVTPDAGAADSGSGAGGGASDASADAGIAATALETVRTYAFHDLTALPGNFSNWPSLSADGRVVAFATSAANPARIVVNVINADGTGQHEIDRFEPLCYCDGRLDISADGGSVVVTDSVQVRHLKGASATPLVTLDSNEISDIRLSADGARVFFLLRRNASLKNTSVPLERGVWVINADGNGLRQVTGASTVGVALGVTPDKVFPFAGCGASLDVSTDGTRIVFASAVAGMESVFAVNSDGTGLHKLVDASGGYKLVNKIGLSGNGQLVGFHVYVGDGTIEMGVVSFDGANRRKIAGEPAAPLGGCTGALVLSEDGGKMYVSEPGYLYDTDGAGVLQLTTTAYRPPGGAPLQDGTPGGTMNAGATRFAFRRVDDKGIAQVMLLELDPTSLGAAPALSSPTFAPGRVTVAGLDIATATVQATGTALGRVGVVFYSDGLPDLIDRGAGVALTDDGKGGDANANDAVFTGRGYYGYYPPKPGPKNLRFTAENKAGGLRHATVLESKGVVVE
jgi:hypothetical protein